MKRWWQVKWITSTITCSRSCWSVTQELENPTFFPVLPETSSVWSPNQPLELNLPPELFRWFIEILFASVIYTLLITDCCNLVFKVQLIHDWCNLVFKVQVITDCCNLVFKVQCVHTAVNSFCFMELFYCVCWWRLYLLFMYSHLLLVVNIDH